MPDLSIPRPEQQTPHADHTGDNATTSSSQADDRLRQITEEVYKHNLELATVNKTLSLLQKLYEISLLELDPSTLADKVSEVVRQSLNLEVCGVLVYNRQADTLEPLHFSKSDRLLESVTQIGFTFRDFKIEKASNQAFFGKSIRLMVPNVTSDFGEVWKGAGDDSIISRLQSDGHIKTTLVYPLITQSNVIGFILYGFNRDYASLTDREKEAVKSVSDVTAVALDKANLYKELQDANTKLESLDKLKTEFLSLASHQLRSPITAIKGYASMLLEGSFGPLTDPEREPVSRIFQSSLNLANVVEDLLDVAKIEQGGLQYQMQETDLDQIMSLLYKELSLTAKSKNLQFSYDNTGAAPCLVMADPVKIRQVVLNLIDNSIKYTEKGCVKVLLRRCGNNAEISVTDSGIGMSAETKQKLFGKFARGEGKMINAGGSGLGLYLAKEIVAAHKGEIGAESEGLGKGSTFRVRIPLK